jgi:GNAT superfamily N-acetyltransferase
MTHQTETLEAALPQGAAAHAGAWVPIRNLSPHHAPRIGDHLLALNERDRLLRFGFLATDDQIRGYVDHIDFERDLVFGIFDRRLQALAMAHLAFEPAGDRPGTVVEFGVSVSERARGRGYGARLFDHAVTHARNRGAKTMMVHIARDNSAMLGIVRRAGAELQFDGADAVARLLLPPDTLGSQIEELVGHQAAEMDYRIKMQVLRLDRLRPHCLRQPQDRH